MKTMKKSMKGAKKTKGMKKRAAKKKSVIARGKRAKSSVFRGSKVKTTSGLQKKDLMKNKQGKVVSKKSHDRAVKTYKKNGLDKWIAAVLRARKDLKVTGFAAVGGNTPRGKALLAKARSYYKK